MNRSALRESLAVIHDEHPQRAYAAQAALEQAFSAIDELAKLGHTFELTEGTKDLPVEFPKMLYHSNLAPGGLEVGSQAEEDALGSGWRTTPLPGVDFSTPQPKLVDEVEAQPEPVLSPEKTEPEELAEKQETLQV